MALQACSNYRTAGGTRPSRPSRPSVALPYNDLMRSNLEPAVHTIEARTLGRYLEWSADGDTRAPLLVGFHGYGENAEQHLQAIRQIPGAVGWRIASVQALHRFYARRTGDVVSSWMTSQDREQAICDNVAYAGRVVTSLRSTAAPDAPLVYAGFSQGVAMAYRAALRAGHPCHGLLVLAGDVPPDLHDEPAPRWPPILLGCGTADPWYTAEKWHADRRFFESREIAFDTVRFNGGHEWHPEFCDAAGRFLDAIRARPRCDA